MNENHINKLYKDYCSIFGVSVGELDEWEFKLAAIEEWPKLRLDILAWTIADLTE